MKIRNIALTVLFGPAALFYLISSVANRVGLHDLGTTFAEYTVQVLMVVIVALLGCFAAIEFGSPKMSEAVKQFCCQILEVRKS